MVRKKGKYKLSELRKKIGKLTAEGTVKGERVAVKASLPQLPPSVHSSTWFASFFTLTPLFTLFPHYLFIYFILFATLITKNIGKEEEKKKKRSGEET